ncbi:hypothetical protein CGMCC3_g7128 [Colletotrichum fructicola]|nr:uncharacterized protein CGMCC3_g7128 [Colletotrichum fructicola]KAE9576677.1 hypothetical protein CGMCC3_g7128 [Colletotrichum fructicola]
MVLKSHRSKSDIKSVEQPSGGQSSCFPIEVDWTSSFALSISVKEWQPPTALGAARRHGYRYIDKFAP